MAKGAIRTKDINHMQKVLNEYAQVIVKTAVQENYLIAQEIMQDSYAEVPKRTGALSQSGFVGIAGGNKVVFGYGGSAANVNPVTGKSTEEYMLEVHEDLSAYHPNGKAKFLQDPFLRKLAAITARLKKSMGQVRP